MNNISLKYEEAYKDINDADVFLWEPSSKYGRLVAWASDSPYCHASIAAWVKFSSNDLYLLNLDTLEGTGGRIKKLSTVVKKYPGKIAWYSVNLASDVRNAVVISFWNEVIGKKYGYWNAFREGLSKAFLFRKFVFPIRDDSYISQKPPYCSAAIARHMRLAGGVDIYEGLADDSTWPSHFAESDLYTYQGHLH